MLSIEDKIKNKITKKPKGWCFTPKDFLELGTSGAIRKSLSRLEQSGFIIRLTFGLYYYPIVHKKLGVLPPNLQDVAKTIAKKDEYKVQPTGAYAANLLGLSEQVPNQTVFLTDGHSRTVDIRTNTLVFKKTSVKNMKTSGSITGLVIQALKHIGQDSFSDKMYDVLLKGLGPDDLKVLKKESYLAPEWIRQIILSLTEEHHG